MSVTDVYVDFHTHDISFNSSISVVNIMPYDDITSVNLPNIYFSTGYHPWYIHNHQFKPHELINKLSLPLFIAIGECGLDINSIASMALQEQIFRHHVELSEKFEKPIIIHCVKAYSDIIRIKKDMKPTQPWILHSFNGNYQIAMQCLNHNMKLSFGYISDELFSKLNLLDIPDESFFLESDNSGKTIDEIFKRFSHLKGMDINKLKSQIFQNFKNICPSIH